MEKKGNSSKLHQISHSYHELMEIRGSMAISEFINRDYLMKRIIEHAKENRNSDEVAKIAMDYVVSLLCGEEKGGYKRWEEYSEATEAEQRMIESGIRYGLMILRELSQKQENISAILSPRQDSPSVSQMQDGNGSPVIMNPKPESDPSVLLAIRLAMGLTKDVGITEIALECLNNMRSSKDVMEFLFKDELLARLTNTKLIVVRAQSQVHLLRIWHECVRWEGYRDWLAAHFETLQHILICMQGNTEAVTLEATFILSILSKYDRFLEIFRKNKLLELMNNIFAFPLKEHAQEVQRKMALIIKNIVRYVIHQPGKLNDINEELLQNIIKLAKSSDDKTKLYGVTSIAYLSKKQEFITILQQKELSAGYTGAGRGTREDLMREIYEVMTGLTQFMKQNKLNKQACKFLANLAKHNMSFDHSIMAFLFNCLTSPDPDLQKYSVKAISCVKISQLSSKFIVSLLHLLDVEDERGEKVKEYASRTLAKISKDPTMQADLVKEPEISSIKHALDLASTENLTLNLITVVGNLSKSQTIPDIHYILYQKGFLEALIKVLENQRREQGLQLPNPKIYGKTVDAISGLAFRHITQDKLIQYNVFKRILEPQSLAPEADQKIVAVAITNMLYTSPQMKQDFVDHGGIKYLQFLLSNKAKLFKRAGVKCVSLLSEHYNLLNQIVKEGIVEDVMKKLMIYELLDKDMLTDILRLTISQLLWNVKVNVNDVIPLVEIALMVNDSLINALGLYIFSQICLRKNIHSMIVSKNTLGTVCDFATNYLGRLDPQYEVSVKQLLSEAWANLVRNMEIKTYVLEKQIHKYLPIVFTTSSQIIVANCSFILQRLAELAEVQDTMIDTAIVDIIYRILTDEESWYLVREMLWTLSKICTSRNVLAKLSKIIPALISHALSEHSSIRVQALMVLAALSYENENHPIYLKYRFLEEVTKLRSSFKKEDDERYLPVIIIMSNLSANTKNTLSLSNELANFCMQLIEVSKPDDILFKEACKSFANITYIPQFDHNWIQPATFSSLQEIIKKDTDKSYQAFLSTLISLQNLSARHDYSVKLMKNGVTANLISIVQTRAKTGPAEVALAIGSLANIYMSCGVVDDNVIELVLGIMKDLHTQAEELSVEQRHLLTSCLSFAYSILKSSPEKLSEEMLKVIITEIATKWCGYPEEFVERIVMKLTLIFACSETAATLTLSFDEYLHFIMRCMTETGNPEVRNDAVIVVAYMSSYPALLPTLVRYDQYYQHLDTLFEYFPKDKEKREVDKYFLNMLIVLFKFEPIRKIACTVTFADRTIKAFKETQAEDMRRILYKVIYFLSFSECTHPIIAQKAPEPVPAPEEEKAATPLQLLVEAYDNPDFAGPIQQCIEIVFANLSFTFSTHPALIGHGILDRLKEYYKATKSPSLVRLPIALALINIGLNPENLKLLEEDFLLCVVLAKEVKGVSDPIKLRLLKAFGDYLNFVKDNMLHFKTSIFSLMEEYVMHILLLENRSDELANTVISILLNIVLAIPQGFLFFFLSMVKMSKYLLSRFNCKRDLTDSYYDKEGNVDAKTLVITIKVAEIALKLASSPKFFEPSKNDLLHDWLLALIEFGNRLTKLRKDCKFEKISQLLCSILSCATDYSITNGNTPPMLENVKKSSIASLILNNLLAKPEILPQLNLEALGCLSNYSQYSEFLDKKELHECDVINRALVVYYAYKDYVDIPHFQSFLVAVLHHFAQNPVFHQYLAKRQFNLLPLLQQSASQEDPVAALPDPAPSRPAVSVASTPILAPMMSPLLSPKTPVPPPTVLAPAPLNDLAKMLDVYEQLTRTSAKSVKHKEVLEAICEIMHEGKNTQAAHVDQGLSIVCNLAANKQVAEEEKSIEQVLKCMKEVHGKYMRAFLTHCPQILSGYLRKWDDARIQKFFDPVIELVKNLLSNYEKGNVGLLFRQFDKLCRPPDLLKRLVTSSDILSNLCTILAGFIKAPSGALANLPRINEILNILQYMSLIDESHKEMRKPVQGGEPVLELCYSIYKNMTALDGDRDSLILKLISSVIHILRNIYKKANNEGIRDYAEAQLGQHIVYFNIARKLLEGEESIKDDDILIKILWSFCSIKKILYAGIVMTRYRSKSDGTMLCKSFATIGERVGTIFTNKQEERAREKVKNIIYVVMKYVKHYKESINFTGMKELLRLCGLDKRVLVQESRFELVLIMNSLDRLSEALDHKRVLQVFQHLVLTSYEDPVIVYYCTEVINKLVATTSPELLINLWCFAPLIESMLQKLKEYTIDKAPHPLLEAISTKIIDSLDSLFSSEATVQWLLPTTLLSYLIFSILAASQANVRRMTVAVLMKTLAYPITFPELLQQTNLSKLIKVLISNNRDMYDVQPKIYSLIKGIVLKVRLPALAHIADTILLITEQEGNSPIRTTYICNLLMTLFDYIRSQGITKDEVEKKMADRSVENCFKAFSNLLSRKMRIKYSGEVQRYLCENIDLYSRNSQFYLRGLHLLYKIFVTSKDWIENVKVCEMIPFLMKTLEKYSRVLDKEPKYIEIPQKASKRKAAVEQPEDISRQLAGYFFERKDDQVFTEYDAHSLILSYTISLISIVSKNPHSAVALSSDPAFASTLLLLKPYAGLLRVQNTRDILKMLRRVFAQEQTQERLTALDVGPKLIELGKLCKESYVDIMFHVCKYLNAMAVFPRYHPYFMTCGVLSFLKNILESYTNYDYILEQAEGALKQFEESSNTNIQFLNEHKVTQFIKSIPLNLAPDQLFGYIKYLKMMLIQGFIDAAEMDKNVVEALLEFTASLLQTEIREFKENIFKEVYEIFDYLLPKSPEYAGMLIRKEIAELIFESLQQQPSLLGEVANFIHLLTMQSPDGVIPYLNQEKVIDVLGALPIDITNCNQDDALHVFEMLNHWFDFPNYYNLYFSQDILKLINKVAIQDHLKLTRPLKSFSSLMKKLVTNGTILDHPVMTLSFELFRRLIYSEDSSIQLTGIYPLHILTQHKTALKYIDIEVVDKLVTCSQSPVSEVRILSLSALANILENCHNPLLVVYHQNWAFLNTIAKLLDSSSVIEKSIALRSFALLSFDIWKMWNPLIMKYEKSKSYLESVGQADVIKLKEPIGKPETTFEDICQGYLSAICSGAQQLQFLALTAISSWLLDSEENLLPRTAPYRTDMRTAEGINLAIIEAYDMEGLNYHTLSLLLQRLKFPDIIARTMIASQDKAVKKAASLAFISLVYGLLPETNILRFDLESLKVANPKQLVSLRTDVNSLVFDYLKDITPVVYYDSIFAKETFTFGEEYISQLAVYAASAECLIHSPDPTLAASVHNVLGAFFSEGQPQLKVSIKNEEEISLREVTMQTNIMNAIFMSTLFLTNIFLCSKSSTELEGYAIPTIEYAFNVLDGINPRSKYDLVALVQSYNYSYDKNSLYQRELKSKNKGFEYTHRASTFFTKSIMYLIYLAFQHYPTKKGSSLQQYRYLATSRRINKKLHTLMQATANNTGDRDTSLLYYAIQRELLSRTEDFVSLIGDGMELYISIQCYHVLVYHFEVAAQFFVELLSYDNMRYLLAFKQTHTKVTLTEIIKTEKFAPMKEMAETLLRTLNK